MLCTMRSIGKMQAIFILRRRSGGISFQNASPGENDQDYLMVTWNLGTLFKLQEKIKCCN
jgi:hypothetical protein